MRKFISAALMAATLVGTLGMASSASAQEWGPRHGWEARHDGWRGDGWQGDGWHGDGWRRHDGYWQARRDWHWRHEQERRYWDARRYDHCRWDGC
jgi:hypothetical protein